MSKLEYSPPDAGPASAARHPRADRPAVGDWEEDEDGVAIRSGPLC